MLFEDAPTSSAYHYHGYALKCLAEGRKAKPFTQWLQLWIDNKQEAYSKVGQRGGGESSLCETECVISDYQGV